MLTVTVVGLIAAAKLVAVIGMKLFFMSGSSSITSGTAAPILVVVLALMGSGGLGYFLDRRSAQASRLAQDAVSATDVFQRSLEEERIRRDQLQRDLQAAKDQLLEVLSKGNVRDSAIKQLEDRIDNLERSLHGTLRDMNNIIREMFTSTDDDSFKVDRWRQIMVTTRLAVIQSNSEITIAFMSPECASLLRFADPNSLVGKPVSSIIYDADWPTFSKALQTARASERDEMTTEPVALSMKAQDGSEVPVVMALGVHQDIITLLIRPSTAM